MTIEDRLEQIEEPRPPRKVNTKALGMLAERAGKPKVLTIDIESYPAKLFGWGLFNQNFALNQIADPGGTFAFAAKWYGKPGVMFHSDHHDGHGEMVQKAWKLLDDAEIVVHFNGTSYDLPHLRREFLLAGLPPTSPVREVDLLRVVKKNFRFLSNKLDHVSQQLGIGKKTSHTGMDLWIRCMEGDPKAWALMKKYNKQDVNLTEDLLEALLPWIKEVSHMGGFVDPDHLTCNKCGSDDLADTGKTHSMSTLAYPILRCNHCGGVVRGVKAVGRVGNTRGV